MADKLKPIYEEIGVKCECGKWVAVPVKSEGEKCEVCSIWELKGTSYCAGCGRKIDE